MAVAADTFLHARARMEQPTPRVALGMALRGVATAAIDVSDGLLGDLGHILKQSGVGACVDTALACTLLAARLDTPGGAALSTHQQLTLVLSGGDDYELLFTAPPQRRTAVESAALKSATVVTRIGRIETGSALRLIDAQGLAVAGEFASFDHFRA
jgi:thiamine-monophosphate kinase